jgi:hypothetical protein
MIGDYFPPHSLDSKDYANTFCAWWFAKHLRAMEEPPLWSELPNVLTLRFLWLRSFDNPIVVRAVIPAGVLVAKRTDGQGGDVGLVGGIEGRIVERVERRLDDSELRRIKDDFEALEFWQLRASEAAGCDGSQWVLEAADSAKYHVVNEWSPKPSAFNSFCLKLLYATGMQVQSVY